MNELIFYPIGTSSALWTAVAQLQLQGHTIVTSPGDNVTHLLLPVPSLENESTIKGGDDLAEILQQLPGNVTVVGGNLDTPLLRDYRTIDLLRDERYLAENAAITAHCALKLALQLLPATLPECRCLVIGWGRIGKNLAALLKALGADVTVAARSQRDLAVLHSLGYRAVATDELGCGLARFRILFNTVPSQVISPLQSDLCREDCIKIDLASQSGILGSQVFRARGLPGRDAPETSGKLIARSIIRLAEKEG